MVTLERWRTGCERSLCEDEVMKHLCRGMIEYSKYNRDALPHQFPDSFCSCLFSGCGSDYLFSLHPQWLSVTYPLPTDHNLREEKERHLPIPADPRPKA